MQLFCSLKCFHLMKICICPWLFVNHSSLGKKMFPFTENEMQACPTSKTIFIWKLRSQLGKRLSRASR